MRDTKEIITICCPTCCRPGFKTKRTTWLVTEIDCDAAKYKNDGDGGVPEHLNIFERARSGFPDTYIGSFVCGTATISEACREGVEVATAEGRPVVFHFSSSHAGYDPVVVCLPNADADALVAIWWNGARAALGG